MSAARPGDSGFTLIEALVAMVILALGSVSLLTATEGHTARITALTDRIAARWAADLRLSQVRLGLENGGPVEMLGRDWAVLVLIEDSTDADLVAVSIHVGPAALPDNILVTLRSYLPFEDLPGEYE